MSKHQHTLCQVYSCVDKSQPPPAGRSDYLLYQYKYEEYNQPLMNAYRIMHLKNSSAQL